MGDGVNDAGLSRHHLIRACEASLRRLETDHIDLYQVHEWDGQTPLEETLAHSTTPHQRQGPLRRLLELRRLAGDEGARDCRPHRAAAIRQPAGAPVAPGTRGRVRDRPLGHRPGPRLLIWSPLAGGLLSGKYRRGQDAPAGSRQASGWTEPPVYDEDKLYDAIEAIVVAEGRGASPAQVALAWLLSAQASPVDRRGPHRRRAHGQPRGRVVVIVRERARLETVSRPPLLYPFWDQRDSAADRLGEADLSLIASHMDGDTEFGESPDYGLRAARPIPRGGYWPPVIMPLGAT